MVKRAIDWLSHLGNSFIRAVLL